MGNTKTDISSANVNEADSFVLVGKRSNLLIVNISAVVFGLILLYPFAHISHYGLPFIVFSFVAVVLWMALDYFYWVNHGIQEIIITRKTITVFRGKNRIREDIGTDRIKDVIVIEKMGRMTMNILIDRGASRFSGLGTFYPGKRLFLTSDAFENADFSLAVSLVLEISEASKIQMQSTEARP
jgi:hypothetical protein